MAFKETEVRDLLVETGRYCCICRKRHFVQIHHIIPSEQGGTDDIDNAIPLCPDCHSNVHLTQPQSGANIRTYKQEELKLFKSTTIELYRTISKAADVIAVYDQFPTSRFAQALRNAQHRLLVWHTWTEYFQVNKLSFRSFLRFSNSLNQKIACQILLAHPEHCAQAKNRAQTLAGNELETLISRTVNDIESASESIELEELNHLVNVQFYTSSPLMPIYIVDSIALIGWYPPEHRSHFSLYLEVDAERGELIRKLEGMFIDTWLESKWKWNFQERALEEIPAQELRNVPSDQNTSC
jgi:hypothetical protein